MVDEDARQSNERPEPPFVFDCATKTSRETRPRILALDLGAFCGWAHRSADGVVCYGVESFHSGRFEGGGMRFLRFKRWLTEIKGEGLDSVYFEEVRRHLSTDSAHAYGGYLAILTAWCEHHEIPYSGVPVGTIKKFATGRGNAPKSLMVAAARALGCDSDDDNAADAFLLLRCVIAQIEGKAAR